VALADGVVETDDWPQQSARWFALVLEAGATGLRNPAYLDEVARIVDRGVDRVEALAPPAAVAAQHAALVRAQRKYVRSGGPRARRCGGRRGRRGVRCGGRARPAIPDRDRRRLRPARRCWYARRLTR
jgi:hypothetical protein